MKAHFKQQPTKASKLAQKMLLSDGEHTILAVVPMQIHLNEQSYDREYKLKEMRDTDIVEIRRHNIFINEQGGHKIVSFKILPQVVYEKCPRTGKPKHRIGGGSNIDVEAQTRYAIPIDTILQNRPNLEYHSLVYHLDEQNHVPIKRLYPYIKPPWRVKVRILRIGEPRTWNNEKGSGSLINLDLVDGEGTEV